MVYSLHFVSYNIYYMKIKSYPLFAVLTFCLLALACSPSKVSSVGGTAVNIRGSWNVTDVRVTGTDLKNLKITAFDEGDYSCFKGSVWTLQPSGNGSYSINNEACGSKLQSIFWSVDTKKGAEYFRFKKLSEGEKPNRVVDGYELEIQNIDENSMVLSSPVAFEGKTIYINYYLSR